MSTHTYAVTMATLLSCGLWYLHADGTSDAMKVRSVPQRYYSVVTHRTVLQDELKGFLNQVAMIQPEAVEPFLRAGKWQQWQASSVAAALGGDGGAAGDGVVGAVADDGDGQDAVPSDKVVWSSHCDDLLAHADMMLQLATLKPKDKATTAEPPTPPSTS